MTPLKKGRMVRECSKRLLSLSVIASGELRSRERYARNKWRRRKRKDEKGTAM
jgi:hypothetical protein